MTQYSNSRYICLNHVYLSLYIHTRARAHAHTHMETHTTHMQTESLAKIHHIYPKHRKQRTDEWRKEVTSDQSMWFFLPSRNGEKMKTIHSIIQMCAHIFVLMNSNICFKIAKKIREEKREGKKKTGNRTCRWEFYTNPGTCTYFDKFVKICLFICFLASVPDICGLSTLARNIMRHSIFRRRPLQLK